MAVLFAELKNSEWVIANECPSIRVPAYGKSVFNSVVGINSRIYKTRFRNYIVWECSPQSARISFCQTTDRKPTAKRDRISLHSVPRQPYGKWSIMLWTFEMQLTPVHTAVLQTSLGISKTLATGFLSKIHLMDIITYRYRREDHYKAYLFSCTISFFRRCATRVHRLTNVLSDVVFRVMGIKETQPRVCVL